MAGESMVAGMAGGLISGAFGLINNDLARQREEAARRENYQYNEKAAENADKRTRALYEDYQSPQALLRQYQAAGLSPSLMFGGSGAGGGAQPAQGAQGSGSNGISPLYYGIDPMQGAQLGLMQAQVEKMNAETKNIQADTTGKNIANELAEMEKTQYKTEFTLTNTYWVGENGQESSIFEVAKAAKNYEDFVRDTRNVLRGSNPEAYYMCTTAKGHETLRAIFTASRELNADIATLTTKTISETFQAELLKALKDDDFIRLNAKSAVGYLKADIATAELDERQKEAWNNLLNKLEQKSETAHDIVVVIGLILNAIAGKVKTPHITNIYKNE